MQHQQVQKAKDNVSKKATIREDFVFAAFNRAHTLTDYVVHDNLDKRHTFRRQTIYKDTTLTIDEKYEAIKILERRYDYDKIISNEGVRRTCENCQEECLAKLYCEHCIRNYLKAKFINWTSGNNDIDDLIQKCQIESIGPNKIIEWIPYNNLQDINYLTRGGFSEIYSAEWTDGHYQEWDLETQQLKRNGKEKVILKRLENVEDANRNWFEEAKSHLTISNKWAGIVQCYGLTQNQSNGNYMLVMYHMDIDLRKYLKQHQLVWEERIKIAADIVDALLRIHKEDAIHRDLHSGNILYSNNNWYISDLGFCGPADKPLNSIYGNLPYIAPEVVSGKEYTFKSDIYSIAMLMWEISSGQPPFMNYEHDYYLAMNIINGIRPRIIPGTPLKYKQLMEQCWDADPLKRPNIDVLWNEIIKLNKSCYQGMNMNTAKSTSRSTNKSTSSRLSRLPMFSRVSASSTSKLYTDTSNILSSSKIHRFNDLPEPKNATEEEQEAFHSRPHSFNIPDNIEDFNISNSQDNSLTPKKNSIFKGISEIFKKKGKVKE